MQVFWVEIWFMQIRSPVALRLRDFLLLKATARFYVSQMISSDCFGRRRTRTEWTGHFWSDSATVRCAINWESRTMANLINRVSQITARITPQRQFLPSVLQQKVSRQSGCQHVHIWGFSTDQQSEQCSERCRTQKLSRYLRHALCRHQSEIRRPLHGDSFARRRHRARNDGSRQERL